MAQYKTDHISFPEDLGDQAVLFIAKEYSGNHNKRGIIAGDQTSNSYKKNRGSVSLYITPLAEAHSSVFEAQRTIKTEFANYLKNNTPFSSKGSMYMAMESGSAVANDTLSTYQDVSNRVFNFTYIMIPQSREESTAIRKIIEFFRYHSLPDFNHKAGKFAVDIPSIFYISLIGIGKSWNSALGFKPAVLRDFSVNYGEGEHLQLMEDNTPSKITMNLTFMEVFKPFKSDFKNSFLTEIDKEEMEEDEGWV